MESKKWLWVLAGLGGAGLLALLVRNDEDRPAPGSRRPEGALDKALSALLDQGVVVPAAATRAQALAALRERAPRSAVYLSPRDLQEWAGVRRRIAEVSLPACSQFWRGGENPMAVVALDELGDEQVEQWAEMTARGVALSLEGKPAPKVAPDTLQRAYEAIIERLSGEARQRFEADARQPHLEPARACQAYLTFMAGVSQLPAPQQDDVLRLLASGASPVRR